MRNQDESTALASIFSLLSSLRWIHDRGSRLIGSEQAVFGLPETFPADKAEMYAMGRTPTNRTK